MAPEITVVTRLLSEEKNTIGYMASSNSAGGCTSSGSDIRRPAAAKATDTAEGDRDQ